MRQVSHSRLTTATMPSGSVGRSVMGRPVFQKVPQRER
jgi:hypothetical protein